ncbi:MAG: signal peptide peptidase SppA [Planctomycetes bacterium]|nr:signal peptide peptidase SppA [Planctomycetota bacterium]
MSIRILVLFGLMSCLSGCGGMRLIIDVVPAVDGLTETVVLEDPGADSSAKIALIQITGMIADADRPGLLRKGENPVSRLVESLHKAAKDSKIKAIVLRINSPGGTVTASDVVYREIQHFKRTTKKPVVVLMSDLATSGGYYIACAGDEIIAHPTTITGSIGVIIQTFNFSEGMRRIGIKADAITSGPNKAAGSPFEPMPAEHRALLQGLVDEFYDNFVAIVTESRPNLSPADLEWITDGRVVTGRRAAEVGLIDSTGDLRDAFEAAKRRAGLTAAKLVKYHRPLEYVGSAYARSPAANPQINMLQLNLNAGPLLEQSGFYYLWDPAAW